MFLEPYRSDVNFLLGMNPHTSFIVSILCNHESLQDISLFQAEKIPFFYGYKHKLLGNVWRYDKWDKKIILLAPKLCVLEQVYYLVPL